MVAFNTDHSNDDTIIEDEGPTFNTGALSHTNIVSNVYNRCVAALCEEMREGFWEQRVDLRGNQIPLYHEDTRKKAIECIKTMMNVTIGDCQGTEWESKIAEKVKKTLELRDEALKKQTSWFNSNTKERQSELIKGGFQSDVLMDELPFHHQYINRILEYYRGILMDIEQCLRAGGYLAQDYGAGIG